jgi:DNA polymerase
MNSPIRVPSTGPLPAEVLIVGEAPGADEEWKLEPFVGVSGQELTRMMHEAGLIRSEARLTNVCPFRPHRNEIEHFLETSKSKAATKGFLHFWRGKYYGDEIHEGRLALVEEIRQAKPKIIVALGETALWALTGETGITSWRGSYLDLNEELVEASGYSCPVVPTYHPAAVLRMWDWRAVAVHDLRRVALYLSNPAKYHYPNYQFAIHPTLPGVMQTLNSLITECNKGELRIACDIETISRHIACVGIAWSHLDALCIPFMIQGGQPYWNLDEEIAVCQRLKDLLTHPNCYVVGQNFNYDAQHFAKHWGYKANLRFDTMIAQHTLFPGIPKALDFISSMYCHYHRYWKDELKDYHRMPDDIHQFWTYNCKDCVITWEASTELEEQIDLAGLRPQFDFQMKMVKRTFNAMLRGVKINQARRNEVSAELLNAIQERDHLIHSIVGFSLNVGSPKQMKEFFYDDLGVQVVLHRKTKKPTLDDEALQKIGKKNPLLQPLLDLIAEKRSLGVFLSTFCLMPLDSDMRMRTYYNVAGTETFRLNSGENAFGSGGNLQNIPKGEEE